MDEIRARQHFSKIPDGHEKPLQRPSDASTDRAFRELVEEANNSGDCIINVGKGYYRPIPHDPVDLVELTEYLNKELARARKIQKKRLAMKQAFLKRVECELLISHTREA